ncbi:MAG: hypothetical protein RL329_3704, partial [Bacteroidota bacterium]
QGSGLSLPLQQEQLLFSTEKQVTKIAGETGKSLEVESNEGKSEGLAVRKAGRPKGRKNKSHTGAISDLVPCQTESKSKTPKGVLKAKGRPKGRKNKTQSSGSELKSPKKVQKRLKKSEKSVPETSLTSGKKKAGRPKGSKNKPKDPAVEQPIAYTFQVLARMLDSFVLLFLPQLGRFFPISDVVADGGFGNNTVALMVIARGFHLIRKLQYNAALYFPFEGVQSGIGRPAK